MDTYTFLVCICPMVLPTVYTCCSNTHSSCPVASLPIHLKDEQSPKHICHVPSSFEYLLVSSSSHALLFIWGVYWFSFGYCDRDFCSLLIWLGFSSRRIIHRLTLSVGVCDHFGRTHVDILTHVNWYLPWKDFLEKLLVFKSPWGGLKWLPQTADWRKTYCPVAHLHSSSSTPRTGKERGRSVEGRNWTIHFSPPHFSSVHLFFSISENGGSVLPSGRKCWLSLIKVFMFGTWRTIPESYSSSIHYCHMYAMVGCGGASG